MHKFKVGDAVRVKAGVNDIYPEIKGKKLIVESIDTSYPISITVNGNGWFEHKFEPWNDAEEWDGEKWVPKKNITGVGNITLEVTEWKPFASKPKPAIVCLREDGKLKPGTNPHVHESTRQAKEEAKRLAEKHKGQEFVVLQEVDSKKVEKPVYPELQRGDVMRAVREVHANYGRCVVNGELVIVQDNGEELFGIRRGDDYIALNKSDFVKVGHVEL